MNRPDIERWIGVYEELVATKQALVDCIARELRGRSDDARDELEQFDLTIIKAQQQRFRRRLEYWQCRAAELG